MAVKINNDVINIYGDGLEACLYARYLANKHPEKKIIQYGVGLLGGIYHESTGLVGFLNSAQVDKISEYIDIEYIETSEIYVKIPYNKVKFKNTLDGNIRFPFNRKSFESEYDYSDTVISTPTYEEFIAKFKQNKNIVKCLKDIFSDSFYVDVVKKIGTNFFNITQSQLDPKYIYKHLLKLESLATNEYLIQYVPALGHSNLCEELLKKSNISRVILSRQEIKNNIRNNNQINYIFEYYDYYLDFIFGAIDYFRQEPTLFKTTLYNLDSISKTITPYDKKYGQYIQIESNIYGIATESYCINNNEFKTCTPLPTYCNVKKIQEYVQLTSNMPNVKIFY